MPSSAHELPWHQVPRGWRHTQVSRRIRLTAERLERRTLLASAWTPLANPAPAEIQTMELLTNGTVMAATYSNAWYLLTPSSTGSYVTGTWSQLAGEPTERLYYGSNIMQNGNLFVVGGEYIGGTSKQTESNTGDIYDSATNSWSSITQFPRAQFGDDPTMLLENGEILAGYLSGPATYLYSIASNTWTQTGSKNNGDASDEENWVKLPDDSVLSYDIFYNTGGATGLAQRYIPSTGTWVDTGSVPVALSNTTQDELGPNALLPNGDVIQIGGDSNTAIFDPSTDTNAGGGIWSAGPVIPGGYVSDDAPGVLLPDGQFLFTADQPNYTAPTHVFDYNYTNDTITDITPTGANGDPSDLVNQLAGGSAFTDRFLMLPNGQALFTAGGDSQLYVYTGTGPVESSSTPTVSAVTDNGSNSYTLTGSALNGASQGATYGDDAEMDSNYPIVSVATNISTTYYAKTTDWNMTGVGVINGATSVDFSLPAAISLPPVVMAQALDATNGQPLNNVTVATFTDPNGDFAGEYTCTINWGDGTISAGTIAGPNVSGVYSISGTHTYEATGAETLSVTVVDDYASGQLSVSGGGVSSPSMPFELSAAGTANFTVVASGFETTTGLKSSRMTSTYGQSVTFTATVDNTGAGGGVPTGSVDFFDGSTDLGPGTALVGAGFIATSTFTIATLPAGTDLVTAFYLPTGGFGESTGTISQVVNQASLTVTGLTASDKVYDAGTAAVLDTAGAALLGVVGGDQVTLDTTGATGTFASPNVGSGISVTVAGFSLSGSQAADYSLTQPATTASITPATLTVSGISAVNMVYDASNTAVLVISGAALVGVYAGDTVNLSATGATGTFSSVDVGTGITVTVAGLMLSGAQANNYALTEPTTTADITPANLTVTGVTAASKVYNASTAVALNTITAALVGVYGGDTVKLITAGATGTLLSKNVGTAITVTVTGFAIGGAQASNYTLTQPTTTASITPAGLTVSGLTVSNKIYDSTTNASVKASGATLVGVFGGDTVVLRTTGVKGTFASADAGTGITVTMTGLAIAGSSGLDYTLTPPTTTANITPATPTVNATDAGGTFNGIAMGATATVAGVHGQGGSALGGVVPTTEYYAGATATGTPLAGAPTDAGVYTAVADFSGSADYLAAMSAPTTFTIAQATPFSSVSDSSGPYDASAFGATATITGVGGSPAAFLEGVAPTIAYYSGSNATGTPLTSAPVGAGIYTVVASFPGSGDYAATASSPVTFVISPATPTVSVSDSSVTYTGSAVTAAATVSGVIGQAGAELEGVAPKLVYYLGSMATGVPLAASPVIAGTYTVVAAFPGSTNYAASNSDPSTFTISKARPTLNLSASGGTFNGNPFVATVTIAGFGPGGASAASLEGVSPALTYYAGPSTAGKNLGAAPPEFAGDYTVVASFAGSADYLPLQSAPVTFAITPGIATVTLTSSTGLTVHGQSVTFVAIVAAAVAPVGTVSFLDSGNVLGTIVLGGSGTASLTTSSLAVGSHSIIAVYSGNANFDGAHSPSTTASVTRSGTTVVLTPHPLLTKKKVVSEVLTAEIQAVAPGSGAASGVVTFETVITKKKRLITKSIGTAAVTGGTATLAVKAKLALGQAIKVVYSGDSDFVASTLTAPKLTKKGLL